MKIGDVMDIYMRYRPAPADNVPTPFLVATTIAMFAILASPAQASPFIIAYDSDHPDQLTTYGSIAVTGDVEVRFEAPHQTERAVLHVWPKVIAHCQVDDPPQNGSQVYEVPMSVQTNDGSTTGTATIPHLQTSVEFCFRVRWHHRRATDEAVVRRAVEDQIAHHDPGHEPMGLGELRTMAGAIVNAVCEGHAQRGDTCLPLDPVEISQLAFRLQSAYEGTGIAEARANAAELERLNEQAAQTMTALVDESGRLRPMRLNRTTIMNREWFGSITTVASATEALEAIPSRPVFRGWRDLLERRKDAIQNRDQIVENWNLAEASLNTLETETLPNSLCVTAATYLTGRIAYSSQASATASATTGNVANYVSADIGIALGLPLIGGQENPWVLVYGGLNIYLAPVERQIPLGDLVGSRGDIFRQIFSITIAYAGTLASTDLENANVDSYLGSGLPGIGVGFRVAHFARVSLLGFFFRARSVSPLSDEERFGVALTIGVSGDLDFVALLKNAVSGS
jgi:hypothetical protein